MVLRFVLIVPFVGIAVAQPSPSAGNAGPGIQFSAVPETVVEQRLGAYALKNSQREPALRRIFEETNCTGDKLTEQPVSGLKAPNLICTLPGQAESEIVVGAHFDLIEAGHGVVDNWTGASLLPSLYQGIAVLPRRHTFKFVGFSGEEKGLIGSKAYVREVRRTHQSVIAMVNMDTLGLSDTEVWVSHADPKLVALMKAAATAMNLPIWGMNVEKIGSTDSESFRTKKIPAITIHSLTAETVPILHSYRDRIEAVRLDKYYETYRLVLAYLALLDVSLD